MARLSSRQRAKLPADAFAGPNRSYPIIDRSHAANAKARAKQQLNAGHISRGQYDRIVAAANAVLRR